MAKFEIEVNAIGKGKVVVDGRDISNDVQALSLISATREPTILQLQMAGSAVLQGEGIVETYSNDPKMFADWLRQVNRKDVDSRALERGGWGDGSTLTDHVLDVLLEMLDETESTPDS